MAGARTAFGARRSGSSRRRAWRARSEDDAVVRRADRWQKLQRVQRKAGEEEEGRRGGDVRGLGLRAREKKEEKRKERKEERRSGPDRAQERRRKKKKERKMERKEEKKEEERGGK